MTFERGARRRAARAAVLAMLLILVAGSLPVAALEPSVPLSTHSGKPGPHALMEEEGISWGVACLHGTGENRLRAVRVRPPVLLAHPSRKQQKVGWRVRVHEWTGAAWEQVRKTGYRTAVATRTRSAGFMTRTIDVASAVTLPNPMGVQVEMAWYGADGKTITGRASHWVSVYESVVDGGGSVGFNALCPAIPG